MVQHYFVRPVKCRVRKGFLSLIEDLWYVRLKIFADEATHDHLITMFKSFVDETSRNPTIPQPRWHTNMRQVIIMIKKDNYSVNYFLGNIHMFGYSFWPNSVRIPYFFAYLEDYHRTLFFSSRETIANAFAYSCFDEVNLQQLAPTCVAASFSFY